MKSLTRLLALTATIAMAGWMNSAHATFLSFGITGTGSYTVNTGNITALTTTKTLAAVETVGACVGDAGACTTFILGGPVVFSTLTLNTTVGANRT